MLTLIVLSGCFHIYPDSPVEESIEEYIERMSGMDIDLTSEDDE